MSNPAAEEIQLVSRKGKRVSPDAGESAASVAAFVPPAARAPPVSEPLRSVVAPSPPDTGIAATRRRPSITGKTPQDLDHKGPLQMSTQPTAVVADDIRFPMLDSGDYIDSLTMLCVTPASEIVLCQLLVSNLGMSSRAGVQVKLSDHTGVVKLVKDDHPVKQLAFGDDGLSWKLAGQHSFRWDDVNKTGHAYIRHDKEGILIDLAFRSDSGSGYKVGDGMVTFGPKRFQFLAYPAPRAIVSGTAKIGSRTINIPGTTGFVSHAYQNMKAHHIACRWHMVKFHAHEAGLTANVNVGVAPKSCDYKPMGNCVIARNGIIEVCGHGGHAKFLDFHLDKKIGYPIPTKVVYSIDGKNSRGQDVHMEMLVENAHVLETTDVLGQLPYLLRTFIKAFLAKPYFVVMMNRITATIRTTEPNGGALVSEEMIPGVCVHEILYLNPGPEQPNEAQ